MCCFSLPVDHVSTTSIFCRAHQGSQFLVYSMRYEARHDLAIVLPLPVPPGPEASAVRFINLEPYSEFFDDLRRGFPPLVAPNAARGGGSDADPMLQVHEVGCYEASYVPRMSDFERLDPRFRMPSSVWSKVSVYRDYGFAVFKLKATAEPALVHPMALVFPRRDLSALYFPTAHIHDGTVHDSAWFDHELYCQVGTNHEPFLDGWVRSNGPAAEFVDADRAMGLIDPLLGCWQLSLTGQRENGDAWIRRSMRIPGRVA